MPMMWVRSRTNQTSQSASSAGKKIRKYPLVNPVISQHMPNAASQRRLESAT